MRRSYVTVASIGLLLAPVAVYAHHAFSAEFDADKPVQLRGTVTKVEWLNPHIWIYMQTKEPDGKVVEWAIEGGAPNAMFRRGWNTQSIRAGTEVTVNGYRAKNSANKANGRDILLPDGRKLFVGSTGTGAPSDPSGKQR